MYYEVTGINLALDKPMPLRVLVVAEDAQKRRVATYQELRRREHARILFGFEQKTNFRFRAIEDPDKSRHAESLRYNLRHKFGCDIKRGSFAVYNHEKVTPVMREHALKLGFVMK